jgi:ribonuclease J
VKPGKELLFCALGGSGEIGMNVNLYGSQGKADGRPMTFSDPTILVELVFADLDFIEAPRTCWAWC